MDNCGMSRANWKCNYFCIIQSVCVGIREIQKREIVDTHYTLRGFLGRVAYKKWPFLPWGAESQRPPTQLHTHTRAHTTQTHTLYIGIDCWLLGSRGKCS